MKGKEQNITFHSWIDYCKCLFFFFCSFMIHVYPQMPCPLSKKKISLGARPPAVTYNELLLCCYQMRSMWFCMFSCLFSLYFIPVELYFMCGIKSCWILPNCILSPLWDEMVHSIYLCICVWVDAGWGKKVSFVLKTGMLLSFHFGR